MASEYSDAMATTSRSGKSYYTRRSSKTSSNVIDSARDMLESIHTSDRTRDLTESALRQASSLLHTGNKTTGSTSMRTVTTSRNNSSSNLNQGQGGYTTTTTTTKMRRRGSGSSQQGRLSFDNDDDDDEHTASTTTMSLRRSARSRSQAVASGKRSPSRVISTKSSSRRTTRSSTHNNSSEAQELLSGDEAGVEIHGRSSSAAQATNSQSSSLLSTFTSVLRGVKSYSTSRYQEAESLFSGDEAEQSVVVEPKVRRVITSRRSTSHMSRLHPVEQQSNMDVTVDYGSSEDELSRYHAETSTPAVNLNQTSFYSDKSLDDEIIVSKALRLRRRHEQILKSPTQAVEVVEMTPRIHRSISSKSLTRSVNHSRHQSQTTSPHAIDQSTIATALRRLSKDEEVVQETPYKAPMNPFSAILAFISSVFWVMSAAISSVFWAAGAAVFAISLIVAWLDLVILTFIRKYLLWLLLLLLCGWLYYNPIALPARAAGPVMGTSCQACDLTPVRTQIRTAQDALALQISRIKIPNAPRGAPAARTNFAAASSGASVVATHCDCYATSASQGSILSFLGLSRNHVDQSAKALLTPDLAPRHCWAFDKDQASAIIKLSQPVDVSTLELAHVAAEDLPKDRSINSAPRDFEINRVDMDGQRTLLLKDTFDPARGRAVYTLGNSADSNNVEMIELNVTSNHGSKYTCVYHLGVYGEPV
eukprot:m.100482 g.100482  ORF g.100482 m.100482 type:complete len:704 (-) comp15129_c0_seq1:70-2181(-)